MSKINYDQKFEAPGWSDLRYVRMFGRGLVIRGYRHFLNSGVWVCVKEDYPDPEELLRTNNDNKSSIK